MMPLLGFLSSDPRVRASAHRSSLFREVLMSTPPDCPFCVSQHVYSITPALTRGTAYRCRDCEKIFYVVCED
jgi:transposase-like protein